MIIDKQDIESLLNVDIPRIQKSVLLDLVSFITEKKTMNNTTAELVYLIGEFASKNLEETNKIKIKEEKKNG